MTPKYLPYLLAIFFIFYVDLAFGQSPLDKSYTIRFQAQSFEKAIQLIEKETQLDFYYQKETLPKTIISGIYNNQKLDEILATVLEDTSLDYIAYRDYAVVILSKEVKNQNYTAAYYEGLEKATSTTESTRKIKNIGNVNDLRSNGLANVKIQVTQRNGSPVIGASVRVLDTDYGDATNIDGIAKITLPPDTYVLEVQYIGFQDLRQKVNVFSDGNLALKLRKSAIDLEEVVVEAEAPDANIDRLEIGVEQIDMQQIKKLPAVLGETDIVKGLLLHPGVSTIGEGAIGFNVRGGDVDQNLILQDNGVLFNTSHALGFFSSFNTEMVKNVELYKGNIPAQYGGRIVSVLDVQMRDGDFNKFKMKGGIGPVSSRISLEGPLQKGKNSVLFGLRSSYTDWVLKQARNLEVQNSSAFFYDANFRFTQRFKNNNSLIISAYSSDDSFDYNETFGFDYNTLMGQINYKSILGKDISSDFSLVASQYQSSQFDYIGLDASELQNEVNLIKAKESLYIVGKNGEEIDVGLSSTLYSVKVGNRLPFGEGSQVIPKELENEKGLESAIFLNASWIFTTNLSISGGLRLVNYMYLGPKTIFQYEDDENPSLTNTTGTILQSGILNTYWSIEPRFSARLKLNPTTAIKMGYSRTAQFINQLFNSDSPTPSSQYQLSTPYIEPSRSHNFSVGVFKNSKDNNWESYIELYGRAIDRLVEYKDFAQLIANEQIETELLSGMGRSYGMELSVKKKKGVYNGWLSYTLSRSERQVQGISNNNWYPSNFDQPHNLALVFNYQYNKRHTFTVNFNYSTGRPTTAPIGNYRTPDGLIIPVFSERNQFRIPDYHRLDLAYTLGMGYRKTSKIKTSWTFSVYNFYGRRNAFSVYFTQKPYAPTRANKLSILGSAFPAVTANFEIQ